MAREEVGLPEVEQHDVGLHPWLELADAAVYPQRACPSPRGHREGLPRGDHGRVAGVELVEQRGESGFLEQVQIVVAGRAVCSQSDCRARLQQPGDGRRARGQLHVASGIVRDANPLLHQSRDIRLGEMHAVGGQHGRNVE